MVAVKALANGIEPGRNQATQRFHVLCPKDGLPPASHQHTKIGARADVSARVCASVLKCLKRGPRGCRSSVIFPSAAVYLRLNFGRLRRRAHTFSCRFVVLFFSLVLLLLLLLGFCFFLYILHKRNGTKCYDAVSVDAVTTRELQYGRVREREKAAAALQTLH